MRHLRSILYAVALAPVVWVLATVGLSADRFIGLPLLVLAGAAYGYLVLGRMSPAGPLVAGLGCLGIALWAMASPSAISLPGYGLAAVLAVPLIGTGLSARRWKRYEVPAVPVPVSVSAPPVLDNSGHIVSLGTLLEGPTEQVIGEDAWISAFEEEATLAGPSPLAERTTTVVVGPEEATTVSVLSLRYAVPGMAGRGVGGRSTDDEPTVVGAGSKSDDGPTGGSSTPDDGPTVELRDGERAGLAASGGPSGSVPGEGDGSVVLPRPVPAGGDEPAGVIALPASGKDAAPAGGDRASEAVPSGGPSLNGKGRLAAVADGGDEPTVSPGEEEQAATKDLAASPAGSSDSSMAEGQPAPLLGDVPSEMAGSEGGGAESDEPTESLVERGVLSERADAVGGGAESDGPTELLVGALGVGSERADAVGGGAESDGPTEPLVGARGVGSERADAVGGGAESDGPTEPLAGARAGASKEDAVGAGRPDAEGAAPSDGRAHMPAAELNGKAQAVTVATAGSLDQEAEQDSPAAGARQVAGAAGSADGDMRRGAGSAEADENARVVRLPVRVSDEQAQEMSPPEGDAEERTQALPVGEAEERTQALPVGDAGERTQVVRVPVVDVAGKSAALTLPTGENTRVLRFPGRVVGEGTTQVGERTRDLGNRLTGDVGGDETQVIRLHDKSVDDERTQVIRPGPVHPPGERTEALPFRMPPISLDVAASPPVRPGPPVSIAEAERPDFAEDPTCRIVPPGAEETTEAGKRLMTVVNMERPKDEKTTGHIEVPGQQRPPEARK